MINKSVKRQWDFLSESYVISTEFLMYTLLTLWRHKSSTFFDRFFPNYVAEDYFSDIFNFYSIKLLSYTEISVDSTPFNGPLVDILTSEGSFRSYQEWMNEVRNALYALSSAAQNHDWDERNTPQLTMKVKYRLESGCTDLDLDVLQKCSRQIRTAYLRIWQRTAHTISCRSDLRDALTLTLVAVGLKMAAFDSSVWSVNPARK